MIPDVASRLLPLKPGLFDVVIFDEASQMPVEHALPALYRAKRMVISGDEKQMPPSSFFLSRIESDEEELNDDDEIDEMATEAERAELVDAWNRREIKDCTDLLALGSAVLPRTMLEIHTARSTANSSPSPMRPITTAHCASQSSTLTARCAKSDPSRCCG